MPLLVDEPDEDADELPDEGELDDDMGVADPVPAFVASGPAVRRDAAVDVRAVLAAFEVPAPPEAAVEPDEVTAGERLRPTAAARGRTASAASDRRVVIWVAMSPATATATTESAMREA